MREGICDGCGQRRYINRSNSPLTVPDGKNYTVRTTGEYCADCWDEFDLPEIRPEPTPPIRHKRLPGTTTLDALTRAAEEQDGFA